MRYLTTYIYNDILVICHTKKRKRSPYSVVPDAGTNGLLVILKKNQRFAQAVIVHTGKSQEYGKSAINTIFDSGGEIYDNKLYGF